MGSQGLVLVNFSDSLCICLSGSAITLGNHAGIQFLADAAVLSAGDLSELAGHPGSEVYVNRCVIVATAGRADARLCPAVGPRTKKPGRVNLPGPLSSAKRRTCQGTTRNSTRRFSSWP